MSEISVQKPLLAETHNCKAVATTEQLLLCGFVLSWFQWNNDLTYM